MEKKIFSEVCDIEIFRNSRVLIDERTPCNCDFFILELVKYFGYSISLYNNSSEHFNRLFLQRNITGKVSSIYNSIEQETDIVDDIWVQRNVCGNILDSKVNVYRSNTANISDYYDYDVVVKIEGLKSGCSNQIDGSITIFSRDLIHNELKYKIFNDSVSYFN